MTCISADTLYLCLHHVSLWTPCITMDTLYHCSAHLPAGLCWCPEFQLTGARELTGARARGCLAARESTWGEAAATATVPTLDCNTTVSPLDCTNKAMDCIRAVLYHQCTVPSMHWIRHTMMMPTHKAFDADSKELRRQTEFNYTTTTKSCWTYVGLKAFFPFYSRHCVIVYLDTSCKSFNTLRHCWLFRWNCFSCNT